MMNTINKYGRRSVKQSAQVFAVILLLLSPLLVSSCSDDDEGYFDVPASQRLQQALQETRKILRSSQYGWELEYYPDKSLAYGGLVYTIEFDSLTATVGCSLIPDSTATSYYRLTNDNGPVLTFDTYNPLLHYYATPSSSEYEAKGGDFEFVIDSIADDYISLYGKKTLNSMCLRRLSAPASDYARQTVDIFDHFVDSIRGTIGDVVVEAKCNPTNKRLVMDNAEIPYTYTNRGIRFYKPVTIGGISVQTFDFDTETNLLTCSDPGCEDIQLTGIPYDVSTMSYAKYEGDYNLIYQGASLLVHLAPNRLEGTYLLQGLNPKYDLVMHYDVETGDLRLGSQFVGEMNGNPVYWVCYDFDTGLLSLSDDGQFTITWNKNRFYPMFNFSATNPRVLNCSGGLLIYVYADDQGVYRASIVDDTSWMTNGSAIFRALKSLNRRTRLD